MLMVDNMHDAEPLIRLAHGGASHRLLRYNDLKNGNQSHGVEGEGAEFKAVCSRIISSSASSAT